MGFGATARCERLRQKIDFTDQVIDRREHELDRVSLTNLRARGTARRGAVRFSKALRVAEEHFAWALGRLFQVEKKRVMPPFLPPLAPAVLAIVNGDF